ncbi:5'/3'-nucleotidase SurE [Leptolyngbya valderiana BDU 20041]|uniref:5'/3'-nucleotidase SurE n=1 Tax=Baaleninema simplex TaxID=2862350 RepID=UPI00034B82AE|nr:5'/3'-nucleotidase SurE [Baaleninema simplex]MDC0833226.1 5'/3'-nucleotidase SurE [Geitlerinema sp. CS-897]OAB60408.1 5'/3'-nucleotidase SurE [Leptolyngbya valderiana BDU 20041]
MAIVLTNDDGIDAPGILALLDALKQVTAETPVFVAPKGQLSGCGHQVTTHQPIHVERRNATEFAVGGTPADCTRLALSHLCPNPSWVLSGINAGGNMGVDEYISGTVAAVREAAFHGIPAIAISQYRNRLKPLDWETTMRLGTKVLTELMAQPLESGAFWNVNLPHCDAEDDPEIVFCQPSRCPLPVQFRIDGEAFVYEGNYQGRKRMPETDVDVCFSGKIAVTQIQV